MSSAQLQPVAGIERITLIDVLRGFSLLGILLVNFRGDTGSVIPQVDALMSSALVAFVWRSFYPLFSFLFGLGFAVQVARASSRGSAVSPVYFRRLLVLFLIGTVHTVFVWHGDILVRYAITALLLIPMQRLGQRSVFALTLLLFVMILNGDALSAQVDKASSADDEISAVQSGDARAGDEGITGNQLQPTAVSDA